MPALEPSAAMFRKGWAGGAILGDAEVPRDPALPQLALMLDGAAMLKFLGATPPLGPAPLRPGASKCRVVSVRYRPGRECLVSYAVDYPGVTQVKTGIICAKVMSETHARRHLGKRLEAARDAGTAFAHWPDKHLVVTAFPQDMRIASLRQIVDSTYFEGILRRVLGGGACLTAPASGGPAWSIVSYRPERACLFRALVQGVGNTPETPETVFARVYCDGRGGAIARAAAALWNGAARRGGFLPVPEPLGYDPESRTYLQRQVAGDPLRGLLGGEDVPSLLAGIGRGLAALHDSPIRFAPARPLDGELEWLETMGHGLAAVRPDLGARLAHIAKRLRARVPALSEDGRCLIHGDFSMNQVLVAPDRINLIDFDDAAMGDPYADLGTFLARMERYFEDPAMRDVAARAFCRAYSAVRGGDLDRERLDWYRAHGFARLALSAVGQLQPGWTVKAERCLGRAETMLS